MKQFSIWIYPNNYKAAGYEGEYKVFYPTTVSDATILDMLEVKEYAVYRIINEDFRVND